MKKKRCKGQSTLEYAVVIAVVVGGLLAMQIYMKRGMQGKLRESTDQIGEQFSAENTKIIRNTEHTGTTVQKIFTDGRTVTYMDSEGLGTVESRTESGSETVEALNLEAKP